VESGGLRELRRLLKLEALDVSQAFQCSFILAQLVFAQACHCPRRCTVRLYRAQPAERRGALLIAVEVISDGSQVPESFVPIRFELEGFTIERYGFVELFAVARGVGLAGEGLKGCLGEGLEAAGK